MPKSIFSATKSQTIIDMVVLTVLMFTALLAAVPLRFSADFALNFAEKSLFVEIRCFFVKVFDEKFVVYGKYLVCQGSVDTYLNLFEAGGGGVSVARAVTWDSVDVTVALDGKAPFAIVWAEALCALAAAFGCALSHCRVHTSTCFSDVSAAYGKVVVEVSLVEILATFAEGFFQKKLHGKKVA